MKEERRDDFACDVLDAFEKKLKEEEKAGETLEKYMRDARRFLIFCAERKGEAEGAAPERIEKEDLIAYKEYLRAKAYSPAAINAMLAGVRALLKSMGRNDIQVKNMRIQQQTFADESRMLTRAEYIRLVNCGREPGPHADKARRAALIMETICSTGIRVSELQYFTVESVKIGEVRVYLKGKERKVFMTRKLSKRLLAYAKEEGIREGAIFVNSKGMPLHRSQIWQMMKRLCEKAGVDKKKVFPHNLRKLFARAFYNIKKDIAKLADVLGHSSINTTRRYIKTSPMEHIRQMERLGLVV